MEQSDTSTTEKSSGGRAKFIIGGLLIFAAVVYLIISSTQASAQYFLTVEELYTKGDSVADRDLRISGAVIGDSIQYDPQSPTYPAITRRSKTRVVWQQSCTRP